MVMENENGHVPRCTLGHPSKAFPPGEKVCGHCGGWDVGSPLERPPIDTEMVAKLRDDEGFWDRFLSAMLELRMPDCRFLFDTFNDLTGSRWMMQPVSGRLVVVQVSREVEAALAARHQRAENPFSRPDGGRVINWTSMVDAVRAIAW